jgi:hypothetical protein
VSLANQETRGPVIEAETLVIEPMGADTLAWFQYGSQRISARLRRAREISGECVSRSTSVRYRCSIRRPSSGDNP